MKILLPIGVYLTLVMGLGDVLAALAPRGYAGDEPPEDEF